MTRYAILGAIALSMITSIIAAGQGSNAAISGTVTDSTRAIIPGVSVSAENTQTGGAATTITNEAGIYTFPSLQPGVYRITAELPGFKKLINNGVNLEVGARVSLNLQLDVAGAEGTVVEVTAQMDAAIALGTSSIGGMITGQKVRELPLPSRNALDLVGTQAGIVGDNMGGMRIGSLNVTRDGINVMEQHINQGLNSVVVTSTDLIQEVRVVTSPAHAEYGRGGGQVQMITKSGTNEFHGTVFEYHRDTALNANTWFNNQKGIPRNVLIRNQFGAALGGPIVKNKTFFFFLWDAQREVTKNSVTSIALTDKARQGIFRFFPGAVNGNANAANPTVNVDGTPRKPGNATGDLQEVPVFGRDPNRMVMDRTGAVAAMLKLMPSPNDFRSGDGLNTAGYTWLRAGGERRDQYNIKIDHTFNSRNTANFSYTKERQDRVNGFLATPFPGGPSGYSNNRDYFFTFNFVSTLTPRLVNELRGGGQHPKFWSPAPWDIPENDSQILKANGQRYVIDFLTNGTGAVTTGGISDPINQDNDTQGRLPPLYTLSDSLSWIRGRHSLKGGIEIRARSSLVTSSFTSMPRAVIGSGAAAVTNITNIPGIGSNSNSAQQLLNNLSGSVDRIEQAFNSGAPPNLAFTTQYKNRHWQERELSWFFKDDFKMRPGLTLNLGVRYEWYGVPYEKHGRNAGVVGGSAGLFGIQGTSWNDLYSPGLRNGQPTDIELVGKNSPNPGKKLYNDDWNNFAPAVGLSWSLPWFGKDKTVLRMGYGVGYEINSLRLLNVVSGDQPGLRTVAQDRRPNYIDLAGVGLPITNRIVGKPLETVPFNDRSQIVRAYDTNLRTPYTQNFNFAIQRQLPGDFTVDLRYVGNKGTKLMRGVTVNEVNILETGLLDAFKAVQAGGDSVLLDRMFNGINLGNGLINGTTVRAGASLRANTTTQAFFINNAAGGFADYINTTANYGDPGTLLTKAGKAPNYIVANPQFLHSRVTGNFANSTYHSMQIDAIKRFSAGWTLQSNLTWSKALGEEEGAGQEMNDNYRNGRNRALDKRLLSFNRVYALRNSGTFQLPFGPGKFIGAGTHGVLARLIERWQVGAIYNLYAGQPLSFSLGNNVKTFNNEIDMTPNRFGPIPTKGQVAVGSDGVTYFTGLKQTSDPSIALMDPALRARSALFAITDSSGRVILANPLPGETGSLGYRVVQGPATFGFDMDLVKRVRIGEKKEFELRVDAINVLNKPVWDNPNTNINDTNFGRITATRNVDSSSSNRIIVLNARITF